MEYSIPQNIKTLQVFNIHSSADGVDFFKGHQKSTPNELQEFRIPLINDELLEGYELLFAENNPAGVKAFLVELKLISNHLRLPLVPLSDGLYSKVRTYLEK